MQLKFFVVNPFRVNAYLLWNDNNEGVLIDPSFSNPSEQNELVSFVREKGIVIKRVLNTHLHLDHVLGNAFVERTFGVKAEAHEKDIFLLDLQEEQAGMFGLDNSDPAGPLGSFLADGDMVKVGECNDAIELKVLHIPGHSPGGLAFYLDCGPMGLSLLFSGDILFCGGVGRSDLIGGDEGLLMKGIEDKLMTLRPDTIVYPGHGPNTTIENEGSWNL
ncbi:MAG: MBL fold metallo-hydrolase [Fibrobacter sp.]|nr:MBL fold metallo-hydrolase [Fibrobacter sp.]